MEVLHRLPDKGENGMTAKCAGACGKTVTDAGKWCPECFFAEKVGPEPEGLLKLAQSDPIRPTHDLQSLRFQIAAAGFKLAFGRESERAEALDKLIHLVHVLEHETHINKQTKKED